MFAERTNWNLAANRLSEALASHRASGKPLLDLAASNPTECGFEYDGPAILQALADPAALRYEPNPKGLLVAREAVAAYYAARGERAVAVSPHDIHLTTSTSEAYSFVFRLLCDPGDEMLIPSPSYPLFDFLADIQDVKLVRYPLVYDHGWQIDFASLERAITPRTRGGSWCIRIIPRGISPRRATLRDSPRSARRAKWPSSRMKSFSTSLSTRSRALPPPLKPTLSRSR